ncbi:MAG: DUF1285 domain-containing protein [Gammaproteobacteria bacterium]|nr:DUF1285 domain-containing protein [Gammaproteobacteria bacterium]
MIDLSILKAIDGESSRYPVRNWSPAHCGEMDLVIRADGTWVHHGSVIKRTALIKLFEKILWRDHQDRYVLRTPVEEVTIEVEDLPLQVSSVIQSGRNFIAIVGANEWPISIEQAKSIRIDADDRLALQFDGPLWARFSRQANFDFLSLASVDGQTLCWEGIDGHLVIQ